MIRYGLHLVSRTNILREVLLNLDRLRIHSS
nr:MAG TPA: hypothetical protein [Bacteriophage sp.]